VRSILLCFFAIATGAARLAAQATSGVPVLAAQTVSALGRPPQWQPYASLFGLANHSDAGMGGAEGIYRPILNPVTGLLGAAAEATLQRSAGETLGSVRLLARVPAIGFSAGIDWQSAHGVAPLFTFQTAVRRGGLLGRGTMLRVDWLAGPRHTLDVGVNVPLMQPFAGRTRPRRSGVSLPVSGRDNAARGTVSSAIDQRLAALADAATLVRVYTSLYSADDERTLVAAGDQRFDAAVRRYNDALVQVFSLASGDSSTDRGVRLANRARLGAAAKVILPYDALFGQVKDGCHLDGFIADAQGDFARWQRDSLPLDDPARPRVTAVHRRWLDIVRDQCGELLRQWKDSRLVWLPLQLALSPEDYASQDQIDSLIARAVGHGFTDRNALRYLRTADLPLEIARSILATRRYHVLWTHDFTGRRETGTLDDIAYTMVADVYLPALTAAVARYDSTGSMPQYFILLDAFYYHGRAGDLWMSILDNPLRATVHLEANEGAQAEHLRRRMAELRTAVAHSARLQREAATHGGNEWLERVIRVHVNITLPSDFSFRSRHIIPPIPFTADNVMRDHRKIAFYDVSESNPYEGALLVTGIGIGEHYSSTTWEDRGYEIRGPAALEARAAARRLLERNGIAPDRIPPPLRETRATALSDSALSNPQAARTYIGHALQVHNEAGFGAKRASVARAMLYSLAPPGSVIVVPDPLWVSETWAAMLAAAAARGCHVIVIAPAYANAPSPEPPIIALERDVQHRLFALQRELGGRITAAGGSLHVGIYAAHASASDVPGRFAEVRAGLARAPWIRDLIPFDAQTLDQLNRALAQTEETDSAATTIAHDETPRAPQLHQKTVLVARASAIAALVRQPGWANILAQTMRSQAQRTIRLADALGGPPAAVDTTAGQAIDALIQGYEQSLTNADRKRLSFYFAVGSQNHDPRGILSDGETAVIVSGVQASAGLIDLFYLMARTTWVESNADIDRLVPPPRGLLARFAHLLRYVM
jgi:hypothetical protein